MEGGILALVTIVAEWCMAILEMLGIGVIMMYAIYATINNLYLLLIVKTKRHLFQRYRLQLAHGILLGLEFLVAADIIKTVALELTFERFCNLFNRNYFICASVSRIAILKRHFYDNR